MGEESVSQWMDPEEVRAMAERLMEPASDLEGASAEIDYGEDFVGFVELPQKKSSPAPAEAARRSLQEAQSRANAAGVLSSSESRAQSLKKVAGSASSLPKAKAPTESEAVSLKISPTSKKLPVNSPFKIAPNQILPPIPKKTSSRPGGEISLESFGSWLLTNLPVESYFVCSPEGKIVVDKLQNEKLVKQAIDLVGESIDGGKSHHVKVAPEEVLEVVEVKGPQGTKILGMIVPRPLSESAVAAVSNSLSKALASS